MDLASVERAAYNIISRREHSAHSLRQKLHTRGFPAEMINTTIEKLQELDLLNDRRFAQHYIRWQHQRFGDTRLRQTLRQQGISDDDIAAAFAAHANDETNNPMSEDERAQQVYEKKYANTPAAELTPKQKQQAARFLYTRGFSSDTIKTLLNANDENNE